MINSSDFYFLVLYEAVLQGNETKDDSKFRKGLKKKYTNKYLYYIANQIPSSFDGKKVGQSGQGTYIIQSAEMYKGIAKGP